MDKPLVCLTLTGSTLAEDLALVNKYRPYIDVVELRADYLSEQECLHARKFPSLAGLPVILTIRRHSDGGKYIGGEAARTILFARALSFSDPDPKKNFSYVDFEEDFHVSSLQDAALAFGIKIIRSVHDMNNPIKNIGKKISELCTTGYEIPKIAFMPHSLDDVTQLFLEASRLRNNNHILLAMGSYGVPSRILSARLGNYLTFTSPLETAQNTANLGHMDPLTLEQIYRFKSLDENTKVYGITGYPLKATSSPALHNKGYENRHINAVYIPLCAEKVEQAVRFAEVIGIGGLSVTIPHKEDVISQINQKEKTVEEIGACNTILRKNNLWVGYNTDASGFERALLEFTGLKNLKGKKVAIIGAGGAARAIAYTVAKLHAKACIFNRTVDRAKVLADKYGFKAASLTIDSLSVLKKYNDIIIQTTSKGMNSTLPSTAENDPLYFYEFTGKEMLYDIVYVPEITPVMAHAVAAGCRVSNGYSMLKYQGFEQFELFTGIKYE